MDMMTTEFQAQRIAEAIEDEKLCDDPDFRTIVDNFLLLKYIKGRMTIIHNDDGIRVEPAIWPRGFEQDIFDLLKKSLTDQETCDR